MTDYIVVIFRRQLFLLVFSNLLAVTGILNAQSFANVRDVVTLEEEGIYVAGIEKEMPVVFVFYSGECPLCKKYTKTIREISQDRKNVSIYLVFCGKQKKKKIETFLSTYEITLPVILDEDLLLAKAVKARVTPEVFLLSGGKVIYSGAIDDWVIKLGSTRPEPEKHYLLDAITSLNEGRPIAPEKTTAIGCFIE